MDQVRRGIWQLHIDLLRDLTRVAAIMARVEKTILNQTGLQSTKQFGKPVAPCHGGYRFDYRLDEQLP
jgi:hypothetical protein